jgi:hypothetical protein
VPHTEQRDPWVSSNVLRDILREAPADDGLLADLAEVRGALVDVITANVERSLARSRQGPAAILPYGRGRGGGEGGGGADPPRPS